MAQSNSKPPMSFNFGLEASQSKPLAYGKSGFPPFSPLPLSESSLASSSSAKDVSMEEVDVSSRGPSIGGASYIVENAFRGSFEGLPPRNVHRRSSSDVPLGFDAFIRTSHQLVPIIGQGGIRNTGHCIDNRGVNESVHLEKQENDTIGDHEIPFCGLDERKYEEKVRNELYGSYVTRDYVSGGFRDGFDSCSNKRTAAGDVPSATRHFRSLSVDSAFGSLSSGDQSPNFPSLLENQTGSSSHLENGDSAKFSLEFGNGEFSESELKKIKTEERLAEIAFLDPKRAKRILANRQSAARSKERKVRYTAELEHKVQALQTEATTLSTQIRILQKDFTEMTNHNNELKFRLKAMEQQARLRDALHEALTAEVRHLKLTMTGNGEGGGANSCMIQQQMPMKNHIEQQMQYHLQSNHLQQISPGTPKSSTTTSA